MLPKITLLISSIRIAHSFIERRDQIDALGRLAELLRAKKGGEEDQSVIRSVEKVKEELEEADQPDQSKVSRWMEKIKSGLQVGSLGKDVLDAVKEVFEKFGVQWVT